MSEVVIAAIAAGVGAILTAVGKVIVDVIKAKKEKTKDKELEYNHSENLVKLYQAQTNSLIDISEKLKDVEKDLKEGISELSNKVDTFHQEQKEFNIIMLRHDITSTYYEYKDKEYIPEHIYMSTLDLYDKYTKLGGNSYVHNLIEDFQWRKTGK